MKKRRIFALLFILWSPLIEGNLAWAAKKDGQSLRSKNQVGLSTTASFTSQAGKEVSSEGFNYQLSEMSGMSIFFGINLSFPIAERWALRADMSFRRTDHKGTIKPINTTGSTKDVTRTTTFFGMGGTVKYYPLSALDLWAGVGMELAKASDVSLIYTLNGVSENIPVSQEDFPFYSLVKIGAGYDWRVYGDFLAVPEAKAIFATNTTPTVSGFEFVLTAAYAF